MHLLKTAGARGGTPKKESEVYGCGLGVSTAEMPENQAFQADATFLTKGWWRPSGESDRQIPDPLSGGGEYSVTDRRRHRDERRLTQSAGKRVAVDENNV